MPVTSNPPPPPKASMPQAKPAEKEKPSRTFRRAPQGPSNVSIVINCQEGWGKTTLLASAPNPLVVLSPRETGFLTLRSAGRAPDVPYEICNTWKEFVDLMSDESIHQFDTICVDTISGMYSQLAAETLKSKFAGDMQKYLHYSKGDEAASIEFYTLIPRLEQLKQHASIILSSHSSIVGFRNPEGEDYKRYTSSIYKTAKASMHEWADAVLFGTFFTAVEDGKASGGTDRVLYTEHRATHDAKNRWGMPSMIKMPSSPEKMYQAVFSHIPTNQGKGQ